MSPARMMVAYALLTTLCGCVFGPRPPPEPFAIVDVGWPYVLFDLNDTRIDPAGSEMMTYAADRLRSDPRIIGFRLVGHADQSVQERLAPGIVLERMKEVRRGLVLRGVPEAQICMLDLGSTDPAVPMPKGVGERENRRVTIELLTPKGPVACM